MYFIWLAPILLRKYGIYHGSHEIPDSLFVKPFLGMFYGIGDSNWLPHNSIMWFLACLIVTEILFFLVHSTAKTKRTIAITLLVFAVLGYLDSIYIGTRLPFSMDVALTGVVFYGSGYLLRDPLFKADLRISMVLLCLLIGLAIAFSNDRIDMNYRVFGNPVLFYASAFSSIFACIGFAKAVPRIKLISYIGQNSLVFFLLQNLGFLMVNALAYAILRARPNSVSPNMGYAVSYVMLVLLVLVPVVNLITSRVPGITGRAPRKRHQVQIAEVAVAEPNGRSRVEQLH
jgi:fucose 4-O-acetylase-like acetyltransferase